jgi:hypothetical protein
MRTFRPPPLWSLDHLMKKAMLALDKAGRQEERAD